MSWANDWRFFMVLSVFFWGLWGFISKIAVSRLEWGAVFILCGLCIVIVGLIAVPQSYAAISSRYIWLGILAGITEALGFLFFYRALQRGPATIVVPFTALYIVITVVLAAVFLEEPLTVKKVLGIISGVAAIVLLSQ